MLKNKVNIIYRNATAVLSRMHNDDFAKSRKKFYFPTGAFFAFCSLYMKKSTLDFLHIIW